MKTVLYYNNYMLMHIDKSITGNTVAFLSFTFLFETSLLCVLKFTWFKALAATFFQVKIHRILFLRTSFISENCFQIMASEVEVTEVSGHVTDFYHNTFKSV